MMQNSIKGYHLSERICTVLLKFLSHFSSYSQLEHTHPMHIQRFSFEFYSEALTAYSIFLYRTNLFENKNMRLIENLFSTILYFIERLRFLYAKVSF